MNADALDLLSGLVLDDGRTWSEAATDWQLEDARAVIGGDPPYNFLTRARGGSKTTDLAGIALCFLLTMPPRSRLIWCAADLDQGSLAIDSISGFVSRTPDLAGEVEIKAKSVVATATESTLEVLPADAAGAFGLRPDFVAVDEIAQWGETSGPRKLWLAISSAIAKKPDARLVTLTTAGDPSHWSYEVRNHAIEDPLWRVAETPGAPPWMDRDRLDEQERRLTESAFRRYFLNEWTEADDRLSTVADIRACATVEGPLDPEPGRAYVIGLDVGLTRDRTAVVVAHGEPYPNGEAGVRVVVDRAAIWKGSRLRPVKLSEVEEFLYTAAREFRAEICFDPYQAVGMAERLTAKGIVCHAYPFTVANVSRLAGTLYQLLRDLAFALPDDEEFLSELEAVRLIEKSPGHMRIDHQSGKHDDRAIALALASQHLLRQWAGSQESWDIPFPPTEGRWIFDRERETWRPPTEAEGGIKREVIFRATATTKATVIEENLDGLEKR